MTLVSIGLPVYCGERFLERSIRSLLDQTFGDFELVVCDNASTDRTAEIVQDLASRDKRIRYHRNAENIGAAPNWNKAFRLSTAPYFKWASHDDVHEPTYLERTLAVMRQDPGIVLCHTRTRLVDEDERDLPRHPSSGHYVDRAGNLRHGPPRPGRASSPDPVVRFRDTFIEMVRCFDIFGLMRSDVLARTSLHRSYYGSDRSLLVELSLYGRFHEVPEDLFMKREHGETTLSLSPDQQAKWIDPKGRRPSLLTRRLQYLQALQAVATAPLTLGERARCLAVIANKPNWRGALRRLGPTQGATPAGR
ncbi:MAG TPA: glycosyltransferase family A protein [Azospirillaceae bacterium]|nr:glycosyltransferase family A protein [Azospirillaceae bacterium]